MYKGKDKTPTFFHWLSQRINRAGSGSIVDLETGDVVDVETARLEVFLHHTHNRATYMKTRFSREIEVKALDQAKADTSDPFAYARTKAHLSNGLCSLDDYDVRFISQQVKSFDLLGNPNGMKRVTIPTNMRRP